MRQALNAIASLLTNGSANALTLDWADLRYKHTFAVRFALAEKYSPATANKMLGALRRVLKEALLLDLIEPQDYQKAISVKDIKFTREIRGRALSRDEIASLIDICLIDSKALLNREMNHSRYRIPQSPLNPPRLGDFEQFIAPQNWGVGGQNHP